MVDTATDPKTIPPAAFQKREGGNKYASQILTTLKVISFGLTKIICSNMIHINVKLPRQFGVITLNLLYTFVTVLYRISNLPHTPPHICTKKTSFVFFQD